jgi:hypothetical protein
MGTRQKIENGKLKMEKGRKQGETRTAPFSMLLFPFSISGSV